MTTMTTPPPTTSPPDTAAVPLLPPTMLSLSQLTTGPPSPTTLHLTTIPSPSPNPTGSSLLLRVTHAALNPIDLHLLLNLPSWLPFRRRPTLGFDFCGVVVAYGPAATGVKVGDRVAGALGVKQVALGAGSLAEYVTVPVGMVARVPEGVDGGKAAGAMGVAGQTAVLFARTIGEERVKGKSVLVNGASGGVGGLLVQTMKGLGAAWVVGVCGGANEGLVRGLGADEVVDYTAAGEEGGVEGVLEGRFGKEEERFDFVLDCAGGQRLYERSVGFLKEGGRFVSIVGGRSQGVVPFVKNKMRPVVLGGTPRRYDLLAMMPSGEQARVMMGWMETGVVKEVSVDSEWKMEDAVKAYEKLATKHAKGKIIVKVAA